MGKADKLNVNFSMVENNCNRDMGVVGTRMEDADGSLQDKEVAVEGWEL